jgi:hypothetical protein
MYTPYSLALTTILLAEAVAVLLWAMPCAIVAMKGEEEGTRFWQTFLMSFFLTPLAGMVLVLAVRSARHRGPVSENVRRSPVAASLRTS